MSEVTPYDDEELSEHGLRVRCKEQRALILELREKAAIFEGALRRQEDRAANWCAEFQQAVKERDQARDEAARLRRALERRGCEEGGAGCRVETPFDLCPTCQALGRPGPEEAMIDKNTAAAIWEELWTTEQRLDELCAQLDAEGIPYERFVRVRLRGCTCLTKPAVSVWMVGVKGPEEER